MAKEEKQPKPEKKEKGKAPEGKGGGKGAAGKGAAGKGGGKAAAPEEKVVPRLWEKYHREVRPRLAEKFGRSNALDLPKLKKIVVNMGVGSAVQEKKHLEEAVAALGQVTGQRPA